MIEQQSRRAPLFRIPIEEIQRCHDVMRNDAWQTFKGKNLFLTGGTGFVGKWLIASLLDADRLLGLDCRITVLSRNPQRFLEEWPEASEIVTWVSGDVCDCDYPAERFDLIVHAATDVSDEASPEETFYTCINGTSRIVDFAKQCGASGLLLVSSGAVYGEPPAETTHIPESYIGGPDVLLSGSAYAEGKRAAEWIAAHAADEKLSVKIARVFSVVGPHLPLDKHFAVGNFIKAVIAGDEICLHGDGTPRRSYIYAADMAAWLWTVLAYGVSGRAYNIGSDEGVTIATLAHKVFEVLGQPPRIRIRQLPSAGGHRSNYVPSVSRSIQELKLVAPLDLGSALRRTVAWYCRND